MTGNKNPIFIQPVVWITGASSGIGRETAKQFAMLGCKVVISARRKLNLDSIVKEIIADGGEAYSYRIDVSEEKSILKVSKQVIKRFGRIDVLVNNAGITSFKKIAETSTKDIKKIIDTDLTGQIICTKSVLPAMLAQNSGMIFNVISMVAVKTYEGSGAYTAAKSGMLGFGKVLREELRNNNIKVVNIIPGATDTEIWNKNIREKYSAQMMKAKSVAEAILSVYQMPDDVVVDEFVVRPIMGDLS
ncbi:MAG: SDR family oxidoreductase [Ignavibacteriales bacterium]|nr:SDR family oxidoreductase [Ignavibacteriales bacterium]